MVPFAESQQDGFALVEVEKSTAIPGKIFERVFFRAWRRGRGDEVLSSGVCPYSLPASF